MSSAAEIYFDFKQALAQADELDDIAGRLESLSKQTMENSMQTLASAWKGQNAQAFLGKEEILKGDLLATAGDIRNIAGDIRSIATAVYNAEMEALRIATERRS